ncbi:MAG: aminopeptidase P family protein, partial [Acidobacteria bacterium]
MFAPHVYVDRRNRLQQQFGNGLLLFVGNADAPMNYAANAYHFRQDSSFLYYFGVDDPDLVAVIDVDAGRHVIFGNDFTIDDIVWRGPQPTIAERAALAGVTDTQPLEKLPTLLGEAIRTGRRIHFLSQYRADNAQLLERLLGIRAEVINQHASIALAKAVVSQRAYKSAEEIAEIETALEIGHDMHVLAMKMAKPGMYEREVAGAIAGLVESRGVALAFPIIFSVHG